MKSLIYRKFEKTFVYQSTIKIWPLVRQQLTFFTIAKRARSAFQSKYLYILINIIINLYGIKIIIGATEGNL